MTTHCNALICWILKETYGELVEQVGNYLSTYGPSTLDQIRKGVSISSDHVLVCLNIMIQQNVVVHDKKEVGGAPCNEEIYTLDEESVLYILIFPRFVMHAKNTFGELVCHPLLVSSSLFTACRLSCWLKSY